MSDYETILESLDNTQGYEINMSKSEKILKTARENGIKAAEQLATELGLNLFAADVGPGSRVEVWNKAWNRKLATGMHLSKYN